MKLKNQLLLIGLVLLLLVFFFIWPGVWRYQYNRMSNIASGYRIDKLTGEVEKYYDDINRWETYKQRMSVKNAITNVIDNSTENELKKCKDDSFADSILYNKFRHELGREPGFCDNVDFLTKLSNHRDHLKKESANTNNSAK